MSPLAPLIAFELRQAVAEPQREVADFVARRLAYPAGPLSAALTHAAGRTWRTLAAALAPDRLPELVRTDGAGDALWIEEQLRRFSERTAGRFPKRAKDDLFTCLAEWRRVQEQLLVSLDGVPVEDLAAKTASQNRVEDVRLTAGAKRAEALTAAGLAPECPCLARLLREQSADPPLLAAAFAYFFRREIEGNEELSGEFLCDGLRRLSAPLAGPLAGLGQALSRLGSRFDVLVAQLTDGRPNEQEAVAAVLPAHLADRPSPFFAGGARKGAKKPGRGSGCRGAQSSAYLVQHSVPSPLAPRPSSLLRPGPSFVNTLGMSFVWIPPGEFRMGSPLQEPKRDADEKPRPVRISRGLFLGAHPVTRGQFAAFAREMHYITEAERKGGAHRGPSGEWRLDPWCNWKHPDFPQDDDHPVVCVSWNDAREFCSWLAGSDRQQVDAYRLPTEAEWEHACRAGTTTPFWPGDALFTDQANYNGKAEGDGGLFREGTTPVWVFPPNAWGLLDMHGNVWEWCADWYAPFPDGAGVDPQGPASGRNRVLRGGSWRNQTRFLRSAARNQAPPSGRDRDAGFRVCLVV
jgi:formylglycine-generating enzyme required for sulfatase activity